VGNAGVLVRGLRVIDREVYRLFLPLRYYDPGAWSEDKRQQWADSILALAHEDFILPRMRVADAALAHLREEEEDADVASLIDDLRFVDNASEETEYPDYPPRLDVLSSTGVLLAVAIIPDALDRMDANISDYMPLIVRDLQQRDPLAVSKARDDVRYLAEVLTDNRDDGGLRRLADQKETLFGSLMGHQQQVFPALPAPTWVWET